MKLVSACWIMLAVFASGSAGCANAEGNRELKVHLAQANNNSPYAFVRAKFEPGEVVDPWAVRFFDEKGAEVSYFVWDSVTWQVAREGRADWGHRYALINHAPGDAQEVLEARARKLQWAKKNLPELGTRLEGQEQAAKKAGDSVCAAMYLLRRPVPAFGKERLTLRVYPRRQVEPKSRQWEGRKVDERVSVQQGELGFRDLPDRLSVTWKGRELFRCAGFNAGDFADTSGHADPSRSFSMETAEGIITKLSIIAQTKGRQGGSMDWQCTYWLFPEGSYVALEGFSPGDTAGYLGGQQRLSIWQTDGNFTASHEPLWETPWWLHQAGDRGFVATHLFYATPLTIGYGNNPFTVNAEGPDRDPRLETSGNQLALCWSHRLDDPAILRLMVPQPPRRPSDPAPTTQPKPASWQPKVDWLYRQYVVGVGEKADAAESSLRAALGAAAGWIDRPVSEEELAALLVGMMYEIGQGGQSAEIGLLGVVPAALRNDQAAIKQALGDRARDPVARTDQYITMMRQNVAEGGKPAAGSKLMPDGTRREGWTGNPCYHAAIMPCYVRVLEFFGMPFPQEACRQAILRYADFGLELLGGSPVDFDKFRAVLEAEWPSRTVPTIPLMLHAYTLKPDEKYARAARILFQDLMRLVERNPHGYFPAWTFNPKADKYDTVYNPVSYDRGITSLWSEGLLDLIGREAASRFVTAQARWFVFSGQLLDTLEMDSVTAIRACTHGAHTNIRNQIGIYLYDDFDFYRRLVGDLVAWSAASSQVPGQADHSGTGPYRKLILSNAGSSMLRWALDIRPGGKWLESEVQPLAERKGFRVRAWNRIPSTQPTIKVTAKEAGLKSEGDVLQVQLSGPAFRKPAEFEVTRQGEKLSLKATTPAKVRLFYRAMCPDWSAEAKPVLRRHNLDGSTEVVRDGIAWEKAVVEWQVSPGEYDLQDSQR